MCYECDTVCDANSCAAVDGTIYCADCLPAALDIYFQQPSDVYFGGN